MQGTGCLEWGVGPLVLCTGSRRLASGHNLLGSLKCCSWRLLFARTDYTRTAFVLAYQQRFFAPCQPEIIADSKLPCCLCFQTGLCPAQMHNLTSLTTQLRCDLGLEGGRASFLGRPRCRSSAVEMPAMSKISAFATGAAAVTAATAFVGVPQPARQPTLRGTQRSTGATANGTMSSAAGLGLGLGAMGLIASLVRPAPAPAVRSGVARCAYDASGEIGACDPLLFWDPIGYCQDGCTKEDFDRRRAVELKHGRLCMVATIGMVWPDIFGKFDGYLSPSQNLKFADVPSGIAAVSKVPLEGWLQILLVAGLIETQLLKDQSFGGFGYAKYGQEPVNPPPHPKVESLRAL